MRKHDARKWLHAILDLLPVILIPVFMIYSHRHTIDTYQVTYTQNEIVDFNQQLKNNDFVNNQYWDVGGLSSNVTFSNDLIYVSTTGNTYYNLIAQDVSLIGGHKYYCSTDCIYFNTGSISFGLYSENGFASGMTNPVTRSGKMSFITGGVTNETKFGLMPNIGNATELTLDYVNLIDLTQMFGSGNEPSLTEFNQWYENKYFEYNLSHKELLNVGSITYNDTDIGSQFMYCLYNSVDKYFNLSSVFNFDQIYDWFVLNIFNGNAPLIMPVVWNIVLYEFIMDLMFLLYGLFMFFIDTCSNLMDRFYCNLSGRR